MSGTNKIGGGNSLDGAGFSAAVDEAVRSAGPMFADPDQVELALGDRPRDTHAIREAIARVGRPRGAKNQRNGRVRDYLLQRWRHPLETLAELQSQSPDVLAAELGCTKAEAAGLITRAAAELAPYLEGKMPVQLQVAGAGHMTLVMADPASLAAMQAVAAEAGAGDLQLSFANQPVSGSDAGQSE